MKDWFGDGLAPQRGELTIEPPVDLASASEVHDLLRDHRGAGWLCTTSQVLRLPAADLGNAIPLSAEVVLSNGRSLHLRPYGGGWRAWFMSDRLGTGPHLAFDEAFVSTERAGRLCYRTWWRLESVGTTECSVWRPFAARFTGWEGG